MKTIGVIGGGAWGTALAQCMAESGRALTIWAMEDEVVSAINTAHENTPFLPGVKLNPSIRATNDIHATLASDIILMVTPAQYLRASLRPIKDAIANKPIVICAKGIEISTGKLMTNALMEEAPNAIPAILTGPTFAAEIGRGLPSAVTIAARDSKTAEGLCDALACRTLRPYASDDLVGAQVGGSVKNVIAIASGMIHGLGLGDSARAALVTRGLAEIARLAVAMGGKRETLMGMCGMGDLMLTCSSMQSRNFSLGAALGEGKTMDEILGARNSVTEGVYTARALASMAKDKGVDMPISAAVHACLDGGLAVRDAMTALLERPIKAEGK